MRAVPTAKLKTAPVSTTGNAGVPQSWTAYILVTFWLLTEKHTVSPTRAVRHQFLLQRSPEEHWHRVVVYCVQTGYRVMIQIFRSIQASRAGSFAAESKTK